MDKRDLLVKYRDQFNFTDQYKCYPFYPPMDGYLVHRYWLPPWLRRSLGFIHSLLIRWVTYRENNDKLSRKIMVELGLPPETSFRELDFVNKRAFQRKKYIHFFKIKYHKSFPEPEQEYIEFIWNSDKKNKVPSGDFFMSMGKE